MNSSLHKKTTSVEQIYVEYLSSHCTTPHMERLAEAIATAGLRDEGRILRERGLHAGTTVHCFERAPWEGRKCFAGSTVPRDAAYGDLWLDTIEMCVSVYVPNLPHTSEMSIGWLSIHPVYNWQFNAFLRLVKLGGARTGLGTPDNYLDAPWPESKHNMSHATDIYHDHADAYAAWYGKCILGQADLVNAKAFLSDDCFHEMLPGNLRMWCNSTDIDGMRFAYDRSTLEIPPGPEVQQRMHGVVFPDQTRTVFDEWERRSNIGFATASLNGLPIDRLKTSFSINFELLNCAMSI